MTRLYVFERTGDRNVSSKAYTERLALEERGYKVFEMVWQEVPLHIDDLISAFVERYRGKLKPALPEDLPKDFRSLICKRAQKHKEF